MATRELEFYPTPARLTQVLLEHVDVRGFVYEPCAGDLDISDELWRHGLNVMTNDIDPERPTHRHLDAADRDAWRIWDGREPSWVITNPPFSLASTILPLAFDRAQIGAAFLLRLSFLEPCSDRGPWLKHHQGLMSDLIIFGQPRPSFTGDGKTDSVTTAWMVWRHGWSGGTRVRFVYDWQEATEK